MCVPSGNASQSRQLPMSQWAAELSQAHTGHQRSASSYREHILANSYLLVSQFECVIKFFFLRGLSGGRPKQSSVKKEAGVNKQSEFTRFKRPLFCFNCCYPWQFSWSPRLWWGVSSLPFHWSARRQCLIKSPELPPVLPRAPLWSSQFSLSGYVPFTG